MASKIRTAHTKAATFSQLIHELSAVGVDSFSVDVSCGIFLYRFTDGNREVHTTDFEPRKVALYFDVELLKKAIGKLKDGKYDEVSYLNDMAKAGIRLVEVVLDPNNLRAIYMGLGGHLIDVLK